MRLLAAFATLGIYLGTAALLAVILICSYFSQSLPNYTQLANYEPPMVTRFHAGDGRLLAELATEKRVFIPIENMPAIVYQAFIAAEDQHFYDHVGIDPIGITRAALSNVAKSVKGQRLHGASTITQQVAKNFLLTNEASLERKIKEALLSFRIERTFTKHEILELYLNEIYLGRRSYGIGAAALNYFDRSLDELSVAEIAYLAALPKGPNNYHPTRRKEYAVARRNYVIGRMEEDGYITAEQAQKAYEEDLIVRDRNLDAYVEAPFFSEEVRRTIVDTHGEKLLYEGGISVRTTVDPKLQDIARKSLKDGLIAYDRRHGWRGAVTQLEDLDNWREDLMALEPPAGSEGWHMAVILRLEQNFADVGFVTGGVGKLPFDEMRWARKWLPKEKLGPKLNKPSDILTVGDVILVEAVKQNSDGKEYPPYTFGLRQIPAVNGAIVAMDPHTGRVLAMVGGFDFDQSVFNRATQASRQPGSAFKPFVYLAALDHGYTPSTLVLDEPFTVDQGAGQGAWSPGNYSDRFYGPTPLRIGIEKSRNVMTARLAHKLGPKLISEYAERFGVDENMPELLSMSLGAGETTVMKITTAYAMLVNGGKKITPTLIDRIQDRQGRTVFAHDDRQCSGCKNVLWREQMSVPKIPDLRVPIADPRTAYQMVSMLEGVVQRGTARSLSSLGFPLAGKTGTTNREVDGWFVGFTPDLAVGVYVGFDNPRPMGRRETGGKVATPIFKQFMQQAIIPEDVPPFRIPRGLRLVSIDPTTGLPAKASNKTILEAFIPGTEPGAGDAQEYNVGSGGRYGYAGERPVAPVPGVERQNNPPSSESLIIELDSTYQPTQQPTAPIAPPPVLNGNSTGIDGSGTGGLY